MHKLTESQEIGQIKVSCIVRRNYGKVEIELGAEVYILAERAGDVSRAYDDLYKAVQAEHKALVENLARENGQQQSTNDFISQNQVGDEPEVIDVETITVEVKSGKRYYKVSGGRYSKFGVRLWADKHIVACLDGIVDLDKIDGAWAVPAGVNIQAKIAMKNGSPDKVTALKVS